MPPVLIPVQAHTLAADDMDDLFKTVGRIRKSANHGLKIDGVVMTMVDSRTNLARNTIRQVRGRYGSVVRVFNTEIPYAVRAAEVPGKGQSIYTYDPNGKVAQAYEALTKEVLALAERERKRDLRQYIWASANSNKKWFWLRRLVYGEKRRRNKNREQ